jgi:hypothetical protein
VEDRREAATGQPDSPPPRAARSGQQGENPPSPLQKLFSLIFGIYMSQHVADVKAQHERRAHKKDTKFVKEIHSHLNLQSPRSPIASEGEESPKIEFFEERLLALMLKLRCSSGTATPTSVDLALTMVVRPVHPHLTHLHLTPLLRLVLMMMKVKRAETKMKTTSEASLEDSQTSFWCLMTSREKFRLKLEGPALYFSSYVLSKRTGQSSFAQTELASVFSFSISSGLENHMYCVKLFVKACNKYLNLSYAILCA